MKLLARIGEDVHEVVVERQDARFVVTIDGARFVADARWLQGDSCSILMKDRSYDLSVEVSDDGYRVRHGAATRVVTLTDPSQRARESTHRAGKGPIDVASVMPGKVVRVLVREGEEIRRGQGLVVVEAMKMENEIASPKDGKVRAVRVEPGRPVEAGATLVVVE